MKKIIYLISIMLFPLAACDNMGSRSSEDVADGAQANDSAQMAEQRKAMADSIAKEAQKNEAQAKDSAEYVLFRSADLNAFFLHGRVKTVTETMSIKNDGYTNSYQLVMNFSKDGALTSYKYDYDSRPKPIKRSKGHVYTVGTDDCAADELMTFSFGSSNLLTKLDEYSGHGGYTYTFKDYSSGGLPASATVDGVYCHMGYESESTGSMSITYSDFDEYKNYTKSVRSWRIHEKGTDMSDGEDEPFNKTTKRTDNITRKITYYTREELGL